MDVPTPIQPTEAIQPIAGTLMAGKYDGRQRNSGKVGWPKEISRTRARQWIKDMDGCASPVELFRKALEGKYIALAWQIRADCEAWAYGKPFTQTAPNDDDSQRKPSSHIAIRNLQIVNSQGHQSPKTRVRRPRRKEPKDSSAITVTTSAVPPIEAAAKPEGGR